MAETSKNKAPGIIEVVWVDSLIMNDGGWLDISDLAKDLENVETLKHTTVGYLVAESKHAIGIESSVNAQDFVETNRVSGGMIIPKVAILSTKVLRPK